MWNCSCKAYFVVSLCFQKDMPNGMRLPQIEGMAGAHATAQEPNQPATRQVGKEKEIVR